MFVSKRFRSLVSVLFVAFLCVQGRAQGLPDLQLSLDTKGDPVVRYSVPEGTAHLRLLRSACDLAFYQDAVRYPIASFEINPGDTSYIDDKCPQGVELFYQLQATLENGEVMSSQVLSAVVPEPKVAGLSKPHIMVDKLAYTMFLMDGARMVRRLPVALGQNPTNRKLHFDRASTPEGIYKIIGLQPVATNYRAYDINYPNSVDKARYAMAEKLGLLRGRPDIGGEIQIHGGGIDENWTWGCMAMRDEDMDWLFSRPELKSGVQVAIAGSELRFDDMRAIASTTPQEKQRYLSTLGDLGLADSASLAAAVARFQYRSKLPVTTELDLRTRELLQQYLKVGAR